MEKVGASFPTDGMWMDKDGYLYQSDLRSGSHPTAQGAGRRGGTGVRGPEDPVAGFVRPGAGRSHLFFVLAHSSLTAVQRRQERADGAVYDFQSDALITVEEEALTGAARKGCPRFLFLHREERPSRTDGKAVFHGMKLACRHH